MTQLFVYGSLIFSEVWQPLVSQVYSNLPAFLPEFSRCQIFMDNYPVIYANPHNSGVLGKVYYDISPADLQRLDQFEGEIYERRTQLVITPHGNQLAQVYTPKLHYQGLITQTPWTPDLFKHCLLPHFLARYCQYH